MIDQDKITMALSLLARAARRLLGRPEPKRDDGGGYSTTLSADVAYMCTECVHSPLTHVCGGACHRQTESKP